MKKIFPILTLTFFALLLNGCGYKDFNQASSPAREKCKASAQKAFELFKEKNSGENLPEINGTKENKKDETATMDYKFNYNSELSLCFMEYVISMQATTIDSNESIQGNAKFISALVSDITKQQTLAGFSNVSYPTGSQKILGCMVQTSGSYDDLDNKPIKDLLNPTQCNSESEFDALVLGRFGIK
jgi:hypothetical protein